MYMNEGERNGSTLLAINIFILVTSILLQKLFPRRVREWKGDRLEFNGCRVARNLENINAFPWPYTSLILGLLYPTGVIVMEVFQLRTNLIFQAGADGALWIFYRHRPETFSAAKDPSVIPIGADQIMHNISRPEIFPLPCWKPPSWSLNWYFAGVNGQAKFRGSLYSSNLLNEARFFDSYSLNISHDSFIRYRWDCSVTFHKRFE